MDWVAWASIGVAGYAAIVATGSLFLEARRWFESGVKLNLSATPDMQLTRPGGTLHEQEYIVANVANRGDTPTTLTHFGLVVFERRFAKPKNWMVVPDPSPTGTNLRFPFVLEPGRNWVGMAEQNEELSKLIDKGHLWIFVYATDSDKARYARVRRAKLPPAAEP